MGGIHATMCQDEAGERVDSVVTGEAEDVWAKVLRDASVVHHKWLDNKAVMCHAFGYALGTRQSSGRQR